jgi:hypothetical protein
MTRLAHLATFVASVAFAQVLPPPGVSQGGGSYVTAGQLATTGPMALFVDCSLGNDQNTCTAPGASACLTIEGAVAKLPFYIEDGVVITAATSSCAAGAYVNGMSFLVSGARKPTSQTVGPYLKITGSYATHTPTTGLQTGAVASATQGNAGLGSGAPSTWGTFTVTGAGWTVNDLKAHLAQLSGGTCTPTEYVQIDSNTATVATIIGQFPVLADATCSFSIVDPGTPITGVLPRPPGALGYAYSSTLGSAFYVTDINGAGYVGGTSAGSTVATLAQEPPISIEGFAFITGSSTTGVGVGGSAYVAVRYNKFTNMAQGVQIRDLGSFWIESNNFNSNVSGSSLVRSSGPDANMSMGGQYGRFFGNYMTGSTARGLNLKSGAIEILQNDFDTLSAGVFAGGGSTTVVTTVGNHFESNTTGLSYNAANLTAVQAQSDGDTFTSCTTAVLVSGASSLQFTNDPQLGSGNTTGLSINYLGEVTYTSAAHTAMTSTTDITFPVTGDNFSLTQLRAATPKKAILENLSDSFVLEL